MRCEVRLDTNSGTGTPTARIEVWESGVLFVAGSEVDVTSSSTQIITFDWDATGLSDSTGAGVEIKVFGTKTGGSPTVRSTVDVGFVEWIADVTGVVVGDNVKYSGFLETATTKSQGTNGGIFATVAATGFTGSDWGRRVKLTGLSPSASLTGFVALVTLDNVPVESIDAGSNSALNGGGDLRFSTDDAGDNQLPLDIVTFVTNATEASRSCQLWIRFPTYASGTREVYMFYKKAGEVQPAVTASFGRNEVFQDEELAHHLVDNSSTQVDSSGNDDGTLGGSGALTNTSPKIEDTNLDLSGTAYVEGLTDPTTGASRMTARCWFKIPDEFSKSVSGSWKSDTDMSYLFFTGTDDFLNFRLRTAGATATVTSTTKVQDGTWHHCAAFYDGTNFKVLVDGTEEGTAGKTGTIDTPSSAPFNIGRYNEDAGTIPDNMQEHRLSISANITLDWLSSEYDNQNNPGVFWTTGTPDDPSGEGGRIMSSLANNGGLAGLGGIAGPGGGLAG